MTKLEQPLLVARRVGHTFSDGVQAINDINLSIPGGAFVALVGASGVGKSTLLRILAGLLRPSEGEVLLAGALPHQANYDVGIVFQRDNLMPWRTALGNARLPLEIKGVHRAEATERAQAMLELVGLNGFGRSYPAQLSGGMAQRVAIARALIHRPTLLFLDEPFGALDALTRERMGQELLRIWQAMPVTVFMVTHSIPEAVLLADEILVMNGRPGTIAARLAVDLPRPRPPQIETTAAFQTLTAAVRATIEP